MFRQKSAKQTNAQTQARQANKQMVESAGRCSLPKQQKAVKAATATPKTTYIQSTNLARIGIHALCLHCEKYPK